MKNIIATIVIVIAAVSVYSQINNWQNLDLIRDTVFGISLDKAYQELLPNRKPASILVAVIDTGIDSTHEDLQRILWYNSKEKTNGRDDDKNGYSDDNRGWNFVGNKSQTFQYDNTELTRIIRKDCVFYDSLSLIEVPMIYQMRYQQYRKIRKEFYNRFEIAWNTRERIKRIRRTVEEVKQEIGKANPQLVDFENFNAKNQDQIDTRDLILKQWVNYKDISAFQSQYLEDAWNVYNTQVEYHLNLNYDPYRFTIRSYAHGNNNSQGPDALHGTHVAGIIGAVRQNNKGIDGIAKNVQIISIRAIPDGDERDEDVAHAIRYATDMGAKVINMSFGKAYSQAKKMVDEAVKYAMHKNVLIVHAAGNDSKNLDVMSNFPNRMYADCSGEAISWLEVAASASKDDKKLVATFSNYGKNSVDVFAPGVQIYSSIPGNKYAYKDGTSMAAPVVSGLAALIWGYYPKLTAVQVKDIIMKSVVKRDVLKEKCVSGGIVNAYNALKLAATYK